MTLTALISLNALLGFAVFSGLVVMLGHGIGSDRRSGIADTAVGGARESAPEQLAA